MAVTELKIQWQNRNSNIFEIATKSERYFNEIFLEIAFPSKIFKFILVGRQ